MKIGIVEMYNKYVKYLNDRKDELILERENYEKSKIYLLDKLEGYKFYIENFTNIRYSSIKHLDRCISERSLINIVNLAGVDINIIRRSMNVIVQINKNLIKVDEELKTIDKSLVNKDTFRRIIVKFNTIVSDEIVYKGYSYRIGCGLGIIRIKKILCDKRIKKRINWFESLKNKKEIILRGETPYKVTLRDETTRKILEDNGGVKWFVYFDHPYDYLWHWSKNRNLVYNTAYYKMRPTVYNNSDKEEGKRGKSVGNVTKLAQLKASNSELLRNYY